MIFNIVKEYDEANSITDGVIEYEKLNETTIHVIFDLIFKNVVPEKMKAPVIEKPPQQQRFDSMALVPFVSNTNKTLFSDQAEKVVVPFVDKKPWRFIKVGREALGNDEWFLGSMSDFVRALVPVGNENNNELNFDPAVRIVLPFVQGQPPETILFSNEAWLKFVFSVFYVLVRLASLHRSTSSSSSPSSSSRITEIFSDDELFSDDDMPKTNTTDSSDNYAADNSDSDDSDSDIDCSTLDKRLFDLYNKNK